MNQEIEKLIAMIEEIAAYLQRQEYYFWANWLKTHIVFIRNRNFSGLESLSSGFEEMKKLKCMHLPNFGNINQIGLVGFDDAQLHSLISNTLKQENRK